MRRKSRGLSSVIGAVFAFLIMITILIPLFVYVINLQSIFVDEANRRLQFEVERLNEELEVHATMTIPDAFDQRYLVVYVRNLGALSVVVPTIYVESMVKGLRKINMPPVYQHVLPGQVIKFVSDYAFVGNEKVNLRLVSMRGNNFVAPERDLGPTSLPYILSVYVYSLNEGTMYDVTVSVSGDIGCVALNATEFSNGCKAYATASKLAINPVDNQMVANFMVAPGEYTITVHRKTWTGSSWGSPSALSPPITVDVKDDLVIRFEDKLNEEEVKPLRIYSPYSKFLWLMEGTEKTIQVPFSLSLGNMTEPLRRVNVRFEIVSYDFLSNAVLQSDTMTIERLSPGEIYNGYFNITVVDDDEFGGKIRYRMIIENAVDELTESTLSTSDFESPVWVGDIIILTVESLDRWGPTMKVEACVRYGSLNCDNNVNIPVNQNFTLVVRINQGTPPYTVFAVLGDGNTVNWSCSHPGNCNGPIHAYENPGTYIVSMFIVDSNGNEAYDNILIDVS